jgi:hypothetical protein
MYTLTNVWFTSMIEDDDCSLKQVHIVVVVLVVIV